MSSRYSHSIVDALLEDAVAHLRDVCVEGGNAVGVGLDVAVHRDRRPVERLEVVAELGAVGEVVDGQHPPLGHDVGDAVAEQRADVFLLTP